MKEAILVASFGTTHLDTLEKTIAAVENDVRAAFPGVECRRAFTSTIVRKRLKEKYGMETDSVAQALARLSAEGYERVTVQSTLLLPGEEFGLVRTEALNAAENMHITIGLPLLWDDGDLAAMAEILAEAYPMPEDTVLLLMGHGTTHEADSMYDRLLHHLRRRGMELCTVEGSINFDRALEALRSRPQRKVHLAPLLLVAGDHSKNDMAGDGPDSLRTCLTQAGFDVTWSLRGLGELPSLRRRCLDRIAAARG